MSKSSKKNHKVVDRRTKAQLVQELAEAQKTLHNQEIELIACGKNMQNAKLELKKLKERKVKIKSTEGDLDKQVLALKEELEKVKKKIPLEEDRDEIILKDIATSKSTFLIHFYSQQGNFQGRIEHLLTRNKKAFTGLDSEAAFEFISKHLPKVDEKEKKSEPAAHAEVLKELKFLQIKRFQDLEDGLLAYRPFTLFTHLTFPVMPTANNLDIDKSTYEISVLMTDAKKENVVARSGVANALSATIANYENKINMPGVEPGKYWLKICTFAPFANIEESKEIQVNFQP